MRLVDKLNHGAMVNHVREKCADQSIEERGDEIKKLEGGLLYTEANLLYDAWGCASGRVREPFFC